MFTCARVRVRCRGEIIADTRDAVRLDYCPFKGQASYYSLENGPENAAWSYEQPYDEMKAIEGRLAFYPDRVDSIVAIHE